MLSKDYKINSRKLVAILSLLKGQAIITRTPFSYENMMNECQLVYHTNKDVELTENEINTLMIDTYSVYTQFKTIDIQKDLKLSININNIDFKNIQEILNDKNIDIKNILNDSDIQEFDKIIHSDNIDKLKESLLNESISNIGNFIENYEELIMKFYFNKFSTIQKKILNEKLEQYIQNEEYEKCSIIKNIINDIDDYNNSNNSNSN